MARKITRYCILYLNKRNESYIMISVYALVIKNSFQTCFISLFSSRIKCDREIEIWANMKCDYPYEIITEFQVKSMKHSLFGWSKLVSQGTINDISGFEAILAYTIEIHKLNVL
jgi:hypothetical protein